MSAFYCSAIAATAFAALLFDLRTGKIPNLLIGLVMVIGLISSFITPGPVGLPGFLAGAVVPLVFLWPLFSLRMMGAGDVKLLMALGGLTGFPGIVKLFVLSILAGSLFAVCRIIILSSFRSRLQRLVGYAGQILTTGTFKAYPGIHDQEARLPFALPVFIGTLLYILLSRLPLPA